MKNLEQIENEAPKTIEGETKRIAPYVSVIFLIGCTRVLGEARVPLLRALVLRWLPPSWLALSSRAPRPHLWWS